MSGICLIQLSSPSIWNSQKRREATYSGFALLSGNALLFNYQLPITYSLFLCLLMEIFLK
jgi:hypothetical protein